MEGELLSDDVSVPQNQSEAPHVHFEYSGETAEKMSFANPADLSGAAYPAPQFDRSPPHNMASPAPQEQEFNNNDILEGKEETAPPIEIFRDDLGYEYRLINPRAYGHDGDDREILLKCTTDDCHSMACMKNRAITACALHDHDPPVEDQSLELEEEISAGREIDNDDSVYIENIVNPDDPFADIRIKHVESRKRKSGAVSGIPPEFVFNEIEPSTSHLSLFINFAPPSPNPYDPQASEEEEPVIKAPRMDQENLDAEM